MQKRKRIITRKNKSNKKPEEREKVGLLSILIKMTLIFCIS
jgi:hypothetical protein